MAYNYNEYVERFFLAVKPSNPNFISAVILLGNFFIWENDENHKTEVKPVIAKIMDRLSDAEINNIYKYFFNLKDSEIYIMDPNSQKSINAFKHGILRYLRLSISLDKNDIIKLGFDREFTREAIIALIRNQQYNCNKQDIFKDFNFSLLDQAGVFQSKELISSILKHANNLPIDELVTLGKNDPKIAEIILSETTAHSDRFALGEQFARAHESLKDEIVEAWLEQRSNLVLSKVEIENLDKAILNLKRDNKIDNNLEITERINRDPSYLNQPEGGWFHWNIAGSAIATTALYGSYLPQLAAHASSIMSLSAAVITGAPSATTALIFSNVLVTATPLVVPTGIFLGAAAAASYVKSRLDI